MEQISTTKIDKKENLLQKNIGFFFIAVLIMTFLGFYPTYFTHFPMFEGFSWVYHFHAFFATLWIIMLIAQAFLIRKKKFQLHRKIGKTSFYVIPFLLFSFFLMAKTTYFKNINEKHLSETDALAYLSRSGLRDILYMVILYGLAILYKKRTSWHLRFFTCSGLMVLGPGLGRFAFANFRPEVAGATMGVFLLLIPIIWLIIDIIKKKSPIPLLIFIAITISAIYLDGAGHSTWWQTFAKWFVNTFFK
jgi:uncharacterized membrane protein YozB (DUF420 family)